MKLPASPLLKVVLGWLTFAAFNSLAWSFFSPTSLSEAAGAFLIKTYLSGIAGGLGAGFGPTRWLSWIAVSGFIATLVVPRFQSLKGAQISFAAFMLLSFLTFWLDTWLVFSFNSIFSAAATEAMAEEAVSYLFVLLHLPVAAAMSGAWAFAWVLVTRELQAEYGETPLRREHQMKVDALLKDAFVPSGPVEPPVKPVHCVDVLCTVCQRPTPSTHRFCSRCGAPVSPTAIPETDSP